MLAHEITQTVRTFIGPATEPLAAEDLYETLGVDPETGAEQNALIESLITTAREVVENDCRRALITQTCDLYLDEFPSCGEIELRLPPVQAVLFIDYVDGNGELQTLDADRYIVDVISEPARIVPAYGTFWPFNRCQPNAVQVRFLTGYATPFTADKNADTLTLLGRTYEDGDTLPRLTVIGGALPEPLGSATSYYVVNASGSTVQLSTEEDGDAINLLDAGSGRMFIGEVPSKALHAIRMQVAHWWRNRETVGSVQVGQRPVPQGYEDLITRLRWEGGVG